MVYLLDADVFIQVKNGHYGFDFCPAFWDWLSLQNGYGVVTSIEHVADDLMRGADDLSDWTKGRPPGFFCTIDPVTTRSLATVASLVHGHPRYSSASKSAFLDGSDYFLVAYAHAHSFTIVTAEKPQPLSMKVKIPDVCLALGVECITPYEMLRRERARFVLGPSP
jgi:hypothetical protein